jgi:hypothetical protein
MMIRISDTARPPLRPSSLVARPSPVARRATGIYSPPPALGDDLAAALALTATRLRVAARLLLLLALTVLVPIVTGLARLTLTTLLTLLLRGAHVISLLSPAHARQIFPARQRARDVRRFRRGMRAPAWRASLSAMATACLRLRTFPPEDERSLPRLYSPITFLILRLPFGLGLAISVVRVLLLTSC